MESGKAQQDRQYRGTVDCGKKILSKEGVTGFFKGNLSNFWRSIGSSLVLVLYDELQKLFDHKTQWGGWGWILDWYSMMINLTNN